MAHTLEALIADISLLREFASEYESAVVVDLKEQSLGLLPLNALLLQEIEIQNKPNSTVFPLPEMTKLSSYLVDKIIGLSMQSPIAYVQTEYWGGEGTQGAIVWNEGQVMFEPVIVSGIGAINSALEVLGVKRDNPQDEFDTLGLGRFRRTEDWLAK